VTAARRLAAVPAPKPRRQRARILTPHEADVAAAIAEIVWQVHRPGEGRAGVQPARCPDCNEPYSPDGMRQHRSRAHGYTALDSAYEGIS
jgi:hypothetical protein